jgi:hypothetical protein
MARHRRRRRRYGSYVTIPSLGNLKQFNPLGKSVRSTDVLVGAGLAVAASTFVKMGLEKLNEAVGGKIPVMIMAQAGPLSTFLAGVALFVAQKKSARGTAHLVGASAVAASAFFWGLLKSYGPTKADGTPMFSDYVRVPSLGLLTADAPGSSGFGLLTADAAGSSGFRGYGDELDIFNAA